MRRETGPRRSQMRYLASIFCLSLVLISAVSPFDDGVSAQALDVPSGIGPSIWPPVPVPKYLGDQAPPTQQPPSRVDQRPPAQQRARSPVQQRVYRDDQGLPDQPRAYRQEQRPLSQRTYRDNNPPGG